MQVAEWNAGEGRVSGAGADGDLRRVPVLVGDQKVRIGIQILESETPIVCLKGNSIP
jgi:hypothetical protein